LPHHRIYFGVAEETLNCGIMDKFSEFHIGGKITFPKVVVVIVLWFLGLNIVAEYYAALPGFLTSKLPKEVNPKLVAEAMHLLTSILLTGLGYVVLKTVGFFGIRRKYPRYYVYCHQRPDTKKNGELVFGHFTISCSTDHVFTARGVSYDWTGTVLERRSEWTSLAISPNTDRNSKEVFLMFAVQPVTGGPTKTWIAGFKKSEHVGVVEKGALYEAFLQEFSWERNTQFRGFAELVADAHWWQIRSRRKLTAEGLKKIIESNIVSLIDNFRTLFPSLARRHNN
jgi:hypothetical protein